MMIDEPKLVNYQVSILEGSEFGKVALTVVYQLSIIKHKYESTCISWARFPICRDGKRIV